MFFPYDKKDRYLYKKQYKIKKDRKKLFLTIAFIAAIVIIAALFLRWFLFRGQDIEGKNKDIEVMALPAGFDAPPSDNYSNLNNNNTDINADSRTPVKVKGVYLSAWTAANPDRLKRFINLCNTTELNALVIDVKNDDGVITFLTDLSKDSKARANILKNPVEMNELLKSNNIYSIARIVCFKDPIKGVENPGLALKNKDGGAWTDNKGLTWLNPYVKESWDYLIDIAKEAAKAGFDEAQFDYLRFPTDGNTEDIDYGDIIYEKAKTVIIGEFVEYAKAELKDYDIFISADVFGIIALSAIDSGAIGQDLDILSPHIDSFCPMIYPSHYANKRQNGIGAVINGVLYEAPDLHPYGVVYNSLMPIYNRMELWAGDNNSVCRPYLQDFTASYLGAGYYKKYGAKEVREQIQAVYDAGFEEWILWNASCVYSEGAFLKK